jgi:4-amino-4-deoxy-L-arabinose transferase-like glycosyltransferase
MSTDSSAIHMPPADPGASAAQYFRAAALLVLVVAAMGAFDLGRGDPINSLEQGYVLTVHEMVRDGHWLTPTLNGRPRFVKPPLPFWIGATAAHLVDGDHASVSTLRGVSVVFGFFAAYAVYLLGCQMFSHRAGLWSAAVWATSFMAVYELRYARHDIYLTAFCALAMWGIWRAWKQWRWGWLITGIGLVLAFQAKGPVSWALTVLPAIIFAMFHRPIRWRFILGLIGIALGAGLTLLPWVIAVQMATGGWRIDLFTWEAIGRVASEKAPYVPIWFYLAYPIYLMPWTAWLIASLVTPFERKWAGRREGLLFAFFWLMVGITILSLPREKTSRYVVPLLAPGALLVGQLIAAHLEMARRKMFDPAARPLWYAHGLLLSGGGIALPIAMYLMGWAGLWPMMAMMAGLTGLGLVSLWFMTTRQIRRACLVSVGFAGSALVLWNGHYATAPVNREPLRHVGPALADVVGEQSVISWQTRAPDMLIYYANMKAPNIGEPFFLNGTYHDPPAELGGEVPGSSTRLTGTRLLAAYLDKLEPSTLYVIMPAGKLDALHQIAEQEGYASEPVMDLTTAKPRSLSRRDSILLARLTRP